MTATVLREGDVEGQDPLLGADMLVLGWTGAVADLVVGLGGPGARLARAASVPVLVVPVAAGVPGVGPVALVLSRPASDRAFEVALDECGRRGAPLTVIGEPPELSGRRHRRGEPSLVVAALARGPEDRGLDEEDAARLVTLARAPVLLVPPAPRRVPSPRADASSPVGRAVSRAGG